VEGEEARDAEISHPLANSNEVLSSALGMGSVEANLSTHRPTTNWSAQPLDGCPKTFEWDDALWSDNAYSDVVRSQDSTIRVAPDQSQRVSLICGGS
jgi:hypothetical protein